MEGTDDIMGIALTCVYHAAGWCFGYWGLRQLVYLLSFLAWPHDAKGLDSPMRGLSSNKRLFLASRFGAMLHALVSAGMCGYILWLKAAQYGDDSDGTLAWLAAIYRAPRDQWIWVIDHSIGYFINDLLYCLVNEPDPLFMAHHSGYLLGTVPSRLAPCGWMLIVIATVMAEATNPLQITWQTARDFNRSTLYEALSLPFTIAFVTMRVGGLSLYVFHTGLSIFLLDAWPGWPMAWTWLAFVFGWLAGMLWTRDLVMGYIKHQKSGKNAKKTG
jgi:hypothetical protein